MNIFYIYIIIIFSNTIIYFITTIGILIYTAFVVYSETIRKRILLILIYLLIISIADPIVIGILYVANVGMPEEFLQSSIGRYLGIIGTDIIYLWLISFTHRFLKKRIRDLPVRYWILIMIIPIFFKGCCSLPCNNRNFLHKYHNVSFL